MKRKYSLLLLPFLLLSSCEKSLTKEEMIPLFSYERVSVERETSLDYMLYRISKDDIKKMISKKISFPVFIYGAGCGSCDNFSYVIKDYIRKTSTVFPSITLSSFNQSGVSNSRYTESALLFYKEGKLIKSIDNILEEAFTTSDLEKIMDKYTYQTGIQILNTTSLYYKTTGLFSYYEFEETIKDIENIEADSVNVVFEKKTDFSKLLLINDSLVDDYNSIYKTLETDIDIKSIAYVNDYEIVSDIIPDINSTSNTNIISF